MTNTEISFMLIILKMRSNAWETSSYSVLNTVVHMYEEEFTAKYINTNIKVSIWSGTKPINTEIRRIIGDPVSLMHDINPDSQLYITAQNGTTYHYSRVEFVS